jgi:hypothetical protein
MALASPRGGFQIERSIEPLAPCAASPADVRGSALEQVFVGRQKPNSACWNKRTLCDTNLKSGALNLAANHVPCIGIALGRLIPRNPCNLLFPPNHPCLSSAVPTGAAGLMRAEGFRNIVPNAPMRATRAANRKAPLNDSEASAIDPAMLGATA